MVVGFVCGRWGLLRRESPSQLSLFIPLAPLGWPFSLRWSSFGRVWGNGGTDWLFQDRLFATWVQITVVQTLVVDVAYEVLLFYSRNIWLWGVDSCPHQTHRNRIQLAVYTKAGCLHWAECLGLLPVALGKPKYNSPEGGLVSRDYSRKSSSRLWLELQSWIALFFLYMCYFSGNPNIHVSYLQIFSSLDSGDIVPVIHS